MILYAFIIIMQIALLILYFGLKHRLSFHAKLLKLTADEFETIQNESLESVKRDIDLLKRLGEMKSTQHIILMYLVENMPDFMIWTKSKLEEVTQEANKQEINDILKDIEDKVRSAQKGYDDASR